ncbi:MAG: hypothetical protein LM572_06975 [Ignisphaera sp.]|nr:hypothetical protein [Ignisphaera sp.]
MCNAICKQILDTMLEYLHRADALCKSEYRDLAYVEGLTGYITLTLLVEAYMSSGMLSSDLYIRFKRALHLYKDFVESLKNSSIQTHSEPDEILNIAFEIQIPAEVEAVPQIPL